MQIRLLLDEDATRPELLASLRAQGLHATSIREMQREGLPDDEQLRYAAHQGLTIYSFNARDFMRLHSKFLAEGTSHSGLILATQQRYSLGEQIRRVVLLSTSLSAEDMVDRVEYLSAWG